METVLWIGLSNAVVALVMALVVMTVACVWRRPAVLHALWLLVLIKLVTPPLAWVSVPWLVDAPTPELALVEPSAEEDVVSVQGAEAMRESPSAETSAEPMASGGRKPPDSSCYQRQDGQSGGLRPPLAPAIEIALVSVWLSGALAWYALALFRLRRFRRLLRHAIPAPESLRQRTQRLAEKLRLRRCPGVWLVPGRVAPMLWAAGGRPRILFPADLLHQIGVDQQNALLLHELAHLRRRDHWVRWLEFLTAGLYWWNPVLWFARRELREAEEQCCDAWVTATLPGAGKTYATALLETLDFLSDAPPAVPLLASGVGRVVDLKRRLTMIMRGTTPRTLGWRGWFAVSSLGALLLPMLPAWVQAQPAHKTETQTEVKVEDPPSADLEEARAELKALEAVVEQRKAEVAEAAARVEAARARMKRHEGDAKVADGDATRVQVKDTRVQVKDRAADGTGSAQGRIMVEITDLNANPTALKELVKQIRATQLGGSSHPLIVLRAMNGQIVMKSGEIPNAAAPTSLADTDKRIIELEMKLKTLLSEVEKLRQERKPEPPKSADAESKPHSYGPAPMEKIPYINQLFKQAGPAKAPEETTVMLERLRAEAERQKAQSAALAAERDASQAKIKMLEDEIAKLKRWEIEANSSRAKPYPTKP